MQPHATGTLHARGRVDQYVVLWLSKNYWKCYLKWVFLYVPKGARSPKKGKIWMSWQVIMIVHF